MIFHFPAWHFTHAVTFNCPFYLMSWRGALRHHERGVPCYSIQSVVSVRLFGARFSSTHHAGFVLPAVDSPAHLLLVTFLRKQW